MLGERRAPTQARLNWWTAVLIGMACVAVPILYTVRDELGVLKGTPSEAFVAVCGITLSALVLTRMAMMLRHANLLAAELARVADRRARLLDESEARYGTLIEALPAVTYMAPYNDAGTTSFSFMSPQIESLTGVPTAVWVDDPGLWRRWIHADDRGRFASEIARARSSQRRLSTEYRIVRPDGRVVWVQHEEVPPRETGGTAYFQGFILDITPRREAEEQRQRMESELRTAQKLESVGQLAAGIAHEINTPIQYVGDSLHFVADAVADLRALIDRYRELCADAGPLDRTELLERALAAEEEADLDYISERLPAAFERTNEGVTRVATIVRAMKEFGHAQIEKAPADLNEALRRTLIVATNEYRYVANVVTQYAELPPVDCNVSDLGQVFLNLIVNAAHAIEDVARDGERGKIKVRTESFGDTVAVTIADDGCGIAKENLDRLFDPFFTTKQVGRGTGQGLTIARSIVDKHGGTIEVESTPGRGSTFTVRLPVGDDRPALAQAA